MSRLVKHLLPLAALAVATYISTWLLSSPHTHPLSSSNRSNRSPASASPHPMVTQKAHALDLQYRPQVGRRYIYSFQRKITIQGIPKSGSHSSEIAYHGQLEFDVIKSDSKGFEALIRAHLIEHELKNPVTLKIQLSPVGDQLKIFGALIQTEEDRQQAAVLKDLLSLWGFNLHEDTVGLFDARFETDPLRKRKLSYIETKNEAAPLPQVVESEHFLGWDEYRSLPHEISGHETTQMGHASSSLTASSEYQILLVKDQALTPDTMHAASLFTNSEALAVSSSSQAQDSSDLNWSTLLATLLSTLQGLDGMDSNAQLKVFGDLARFLRSHPTSSAELVDLLRAQGAIQQGIQSSLFKTVLGSLISSGTAEGQSAALKVYSDPNCPASGKGAILAALTTTQAPLTRATQDFLTTTMSAESNKDLAQGASYALGSSLSKMPDGDQKSELIESLRQTLIKSDGNISDQLSALDAIGNSGQAAYLPELRTFITQSESSSVLKAKAVFALRFIRSDEAIHLLAQSLSSSDYQVRQSAARAIALASWSDSFRAPLQNCASTDPLSSIQSICRSTLAASDPKLASN